MRDTWHQMPRVPNLHSVSWEDQMRFGGVKKVSNLSQAVQTVFFFFTERAASAPAPRKQAICKEACKSLLLNPCGGRSRSRHSVSRSAAGRCDTTLGSQHPALSARPSLAIRESPRRVLGGGGTLARPRRPAPSVIFPLQRRTVEPTAFTSSRSCQLQPPEHWRRVGCTCV